MRLNFISIGAVIFYVIIDQDYRGIFIYSKVSSFKGNCCAVAFYPPHPNRCGIFYAKAVSVIG